MTDLSKDRVLVTGAKGFLGRHVVEVLRDRGLPASQLFTPAREEYDLVDEAAVKRLYRDVKPDVILHIAAEAGGIAANQAHPGRFFFANMAMGLNLVEQGRKHGLRKIVHLSTACGYPEHATVPFQEDAVWTGYPEPNTAAYGIAKSTLGVMLDAYNQEYGLDAAVLIPTNLYGPGAVTTPDPSDLHVIPAMVKRFCDAADSGQESATCWGTGEASREFLFVRDAAEAVVRAAERQTPAAPINLGSGHEIKIRDLAVEVAAACGFDGEIHWDDKMPEGQTRRTLDTSRAASILDWRAETTLKEGLRQTAAAYRGL